MTKKEFVTYVRENAGWKEYPSDDEIARRFTKSVQKECEEFLSKNTQKEDFKFIYRLLH